ncbi:DUF3592 domain-containing protein [Alloalcanivorax marinus]|uniref:DUF3592 domain-containing protein n=1 Tax=Alloalcanivorax marinus TaxID=1177169 RepID=UPI001932B4A0|nr:DUF3592 domain-containing protein [Alloalcanivorax marinus]MBL7250516.1 DUF3592 domain-containing protein [Alloalcanivorax marinus]
MKVTTVAGGGLLLFGVLTLAGSGASAVSTSRFLETAVTTSGVVTDLVPKRDSDGDVLYSPKVHFRDRDGRSVVFVPNMSSRPPAYSVGEGVEVLYAPGDSGDARIRSFFSLWGLSLIAGVVGLILTVVGTGLLLWPRWKARKVAWLRKNGQKVAAEPVEVVLDHSLQVNGRHPYRIVCQWSDPVSGETHVFRSDALWADPSPALGSQPLTVWVAPDNPRRYHVDLAFLEAR